MKCKLRINVVLNGGEANSILQVLAKYLNKDSKFDFNQDVLNANITYDYTNPPVEIFKEIASSKTCTAKIEIVKEQDSSSVIEEDKTQSKTWHERNEESAIKSDDNITLKMIEKAEIYEILKEVISAKSNAVFKNKISELLGFKRGIRRQVFEDMLDAAINCCQIQSFEDVNKYWAKRKKANKKINISYAINKVERFFKEKGYKVDIVVFLKAIRELNNERAKNVVMQRNSSSARKKILQNGVEQSESQKFILPLEDLNNIYVFREFFTNQIDTNKSKKENLHVLLDIFKCDEFTDDIRETFELYIRIALKIKVVNKETLRENIIGLPESKKPKVSEDTLNQFIVKWFKDKKSVCCGLERFLQLLRRECRHIKL